MGDELDPARVNAEAWHRPLNSLIWLADFYQAPLSKLLPKLVCSTSSVGFSWIEWSRLSNSLSLITPHLRK